MIDLLKQSLALCGHSKFAVRTVERQIHPPKLPSGDKVGSGDGGYQQSDGRRPRISKEEQLGDRSTNSASRS
ncbi:hypothetical protein [Bradyrhizobium niftali]|uniref:hypothetical protein n=1 Tax=Bradyrhizobium niftali TaxID=2560055 RepID=UPI00384F87A2